MLSCNHRRVTKKQTDMSLFQFLQLQAVEPEDGSSELDFFDHDEISLDDTIDGDILDRSWNSILQNSDPDR